MALTITKVVVCRHRPPEQGYDEPHILDEVHFCADAADGRHVSWMTCVPKGQLSPAVFVPLTEKAMDMLERMA